MKESTKNKYYQNKRKKQGKKAQEEMFGFILIVVLIMIIGLVFLFLRKPKQAELESSIQIDNLLYSILSCTSGDKQVKEIIEDYYITEDEEIYAQLEEELKEMLAITLTKSSLIVGQQLQGYSLNITITDSRDLLVITEGPLIGNILGSVVPLHAEPQDIMVILSFYY